jgi:hypothetical protein
VILGKFNDSRDEGVLRGIIDKWFAFEDGSNGKKRGWGDFKMGNLDSSEEVIGSVINTRSDIVIMFHVGHPEDDHMVKPILLFESANILSEVLKIGLLVATRDHIICTSLLVGGNKVGVANQGERLA